MAVPANVASSIATTSGNLIAVGAGNREDLENAIYNISPTQTPFMSSIGRGTVKARKHEWQIDTLAAQDLSNKNIEGDDATTDAPTNTSRINNLTVISDKVARVSGSQEVVDKAGKNSEMAYQLAKKSAELKLDMEGIMSGISQYIVGSDSVAQSCAGYETWISDVQSSRGATGADTAGLSSSAPQTVFQPNASAGPTDGTQRAFVESDFKTVLAALFTSGGDPTMCIVSAANKQRASGFAGYATRFDKSEDKSITAAIDYYVSDFGTVRFVPSRFTRARSALVVDPTYWAVGYLRSFRQWDLAKTGDSDRKQLLSEWTIVAKNPTSSGIVADLT